MIHHWWERFEIREADRHCRNSALIFVRDFVSEAGNGDEGLHFQQQFASLGITDFYEDCLVRGLYSKLVKLSAKQSRTFRGYLLDPTYQPLTDSGIARLLKRNPNA